MFCDLGHETSDTVTQTQIRAYRRFEGIVNTGYAVRAVGLWGGKLPFVSESGPSAFYPTGETLQPAWALWGAHCAYPGAPRSSSQTPSCSF